MQALFALSWAGASAPALAGGFDSGSVPFGQMLLLLSAVALMWLFWRLVSRRREREAMLQEQIRERESRLNLALWGSGDEFWDWNIRDNTLYRLGANQLFGKGSLETMSTDEWRSNSIHPDDLPRVQKLLAGAHRRQVRAFRFRAPDPRRGRLGLGAFARQDRRARRRRRARCASPAPRATSPLPRRADRERRSRRRCCAA